MPSILFVTCVFFLLTVNFSNASPEQGKWIKEYINVKSVAPPPFANSLFNGSFIHLKVLCLIENSNTKLVFTARLLQKRCWNDFLQLDEQVNSISQAKTWIDNRTVEFQGTFQCFDVYQPSYHSETNSETGTFEKDSGTEVDTIEETENVNKKKRSSENGDSAKQNKKAAADADYQITIPVVNDGMYVLQMSLQAQKACNLSIQVDMKGPHGYLSAADWPLLPFYGAMCIVYVIFGVAWLVVSFCQWRDLLRIQFWIGGVILLGMLEKATFYAEYQNLNSTGQSVKGVVLMAELVSCAKRMLARMLVIIVSLGFGIVKPRLGPMLHRVVGTGVLYFVLAATESYLRVMHQKNDHSNQVLISGIPLAVLDSAICWWIFTSLVQTTRTLRLRRNLVKLSLYHHFTNTLIFAVGSSIIFMLYSIKYHKFTSCLKDWKELWVDDAYWHLLFSVILLVIMILWRPTNNNQRYAFTPLLDAPEDDDEEDEQFVNDAFGVKLRSNRSNSPKPKSSNSVEDDLKWVEENIPSSVPDTALPILDSDEEIMTTKFEVSKMQ